MSQFLDWIASLVQDSLLLREEVECRTWGGAILRTDIEWLGERWHENRFLIRNH